VETGAVSANGRPPVSRRGNATAPPLGTRPGRSPKAPYKPKAPCYKQGVPDLNAAQIGGGP
jgi:hypothetical protein